MDSLLTRRMRAIPPYMYSRMDENDDEKEMLSELIAESHVLLGLPESGNALELLTDAIGTAYLLGYIRGTQEPAYSEN